MAFYLFYKLQGYEGTLLGILPLFRMIGLVSLFRVLGLVPLFRILGKVGNIIHTYIQTDRQAGRQT